MKNLFNTLHNWFCKDTHVVVKAGPHMEAQHHITLSTVFTGNDLDEWTISKSTQKWPEKTGTYSVINWENFYNPASIAWWAAFHSMNDSVDVAGEIECIPDTIKPFVYFGVNNPTIGCPYINIWAVDGSAYYKKRLYENESFTFSDNSGHNIYVQRLNDSSNKEWLITIDP